MRDGFNSISVFTKTLRVCFTVGYNIKPSVLYFLARKLSCCFVFVISYISSDCFLFFKLPAYNSLCFNTHATRTQCLCRRGNTHTQRTREKPASQYSLFCALEVPFQAAPLASENSRGLSPHPSEASADLRDVTSDGTLVM